MQTNLQSQSLFIASWTVPAFDLDFHTTYVIQTGLVHSGKGTNNLGASD